MLGMLAGQSAGAVLRYQLKFVLSLQVARHPDVTGARCDGFVNTVETISKA